MGSPSLKFSDFDKALLQAGLCNNDIKAKEALTYLLANFSTAHISTKNRQHLALIHKRFPNETASTIKPLATACQKRAWIFQQSLQGKLKKLFSAFQENNIKFLVIKGLSLNPLYEANGWSREMADADILVDAEQLREVHRILKQQKWHVDPWIFFKKALTW